MPTPSKTTNTAAKPDKPKATGRFVTASEGQKIVQVAKSWVGTPYASIGSIYSGGKSVKKLGADCSGSVWSIYKEAGFPFGRHGHYFNSVAFVDLVASDPHFIVAWFKDLVGADADFVKGQHFFKQVSLQQVGDIGWWHNGKAGKAAAGHMSIYDPDSGPAPPNNVQGNAWSARDTGKNFSSVRYQWYDDIFKKPAKWYRYWKVS